MSKYIDVERLKAEIEDRRREFINKGEQDLHDAEVIRRSTISSCNDFLSLINSLQQEQPEVDLEKEIIRYYYANLGMIISPRNTKDIVANIARHFYELGLKARKESKV